LQPRPTLDRGASEFLSLIAPRKRLPDQKNLAKEFLSVRMFPELAEEQIEYVVRGVCGVTGPEALV
jgi:dTDP-4-amino-4,6-dideoxygalactose transaminase